MRKKQKIVSQKDGGGGHTINWYKTDILLIIPITICEINTVLVL